jgi:hypothetical protein
MTNPLVLSENCTGPNPACREAHKAGRPVHMIPAMPRMGVDIVIEDGAARVITPTLVMPTYHYANVSEGVEAIDQAMNTAPTVVTDDDLYAYRKAGVPHFLPVGWIDPTRR